MSGSLGDLQNALRGGDVLSSIAHPNVVNPLAAYKDALSTAGGVYDLRQKQANEAAGQAFLNSIDPATGLPRTALLNQNLRANPATAMAAQEAAAKGQTLDHNTFVTNMAKSDAVSGAITGLIGQYPNGVPQEAINAEIDRVAPTVGWTPEQVAQAKGQFSGDPSANTQALIRSKVMHLQAQQQFLATVPTPGISRQPQGDVPYVQQPVTSKTPGTMTPAGAGIGAGATPGEGMTLVDTTVKMPDGTFQTVKVPRQYLPGYVPGTPTGANAPAGATPQGGQQPPAALPPGYTGRGVPTPPPALTNPNKPPAATAPPTSTTAPPTATSAPGSPVVQTPAGPGVLASPPQGQPELLQNDIKLKQDASTAIAGQNTRLIAGQNAMEALKMAGNYTGAGTGTAASLYAWLQARGGTGSGSLGVGGYAVPQGNMSETAWREVLAKNLLRFAQDQGRASGTDLGLETNLASQPNADRILPAANRHILIQDIGTLRQQMAQTRAMPDPGAGTVRDHIASYPTNTDRRGFAWDYYSQPERDAIEAEVKKQGPAAVKALHRSIEDAVKYNLIPDPRQSTQGAATPPPPASVASPPPSVPVTMAQPNALAAYA
jgi:hypothetical protein